MELWFYTDKVPQIAIVGTGYVGLSTGACLSHLGHTVACLDVDIHKIEQLQRGKIPIVEEGLSGLVVAGLQKKTLSFTTSKQDALASAAVVFLCLPTPQGEDGSADLSYLRESVDVVSLLKFPRVVDGRNTLHREKWLKAGFTYRGVGR